MLARYNTAEHHTDLRLFSKNRNNPLDPVRRYEAIVIGDQQILTVSGCERLIACSTSPNGLGTKVTEARLPLVRCHRLPCGAIIALIHHQHLILRAAAVQYRVQCGRHAGAAIAGRNNDTGS
jgi:hypothetical protein